MDDFTRRRIGKELKDLQTEADTFMRMAQVALREYERVMREKSDLMLGRKTGGQKPGGVA